MAEKMRGTGAALVAMASGMALLGLTSSSAEATLTIDVRATSGSNSKLVSNAKAGDTIQLQVVAMLVGADATANEGIQSILGSFASVQAAGATTQGNFGANGTGSWNPTAQFNNGGSFQPGRLQDLNGLPGLDLGSTAASSDAAATDYVQARSPSLTAAPTAGTPQTPAEIILGTLTFVVTGGAGNVSLNWYPLVSGGGLTPAAGGGYDANAAIWREDGANKRPTTGTLAVGNPVVVNIAIPEPTSIGLLGLGSLGLLARRRRPHA